MRSRHTSDRTTDLALLVLGYLRSMLITLSVLLLSTNFVFAQDDSDAEETEEVEAEEDGELIIEEEITVVGTRLETPDPTQRLEVITEEMIQARGLSTAEDIVRSIPQNFSSINSATNLDPNGGVDILPGVMGLGVSTANLRGFGSANTLVLVNGKRLAAKAGANEFYTNLRDIPVGSIERVEILLDGGATIYGSDAIGGVVNFVTKKDYRGVKITVRSENSNTGAHQNRVSSNLGYRWRGGGITTNLSYLDSNPVATSKTGYTTQDYSPLFGGNQQYNFFSNRRLKSAGVSSSPWGPFTMTLGQGNDGRNAQPSDFREATMDDWSTNIEADQTGYTRDRGFTIDIEQNFTENLYMNLEFARNKSFTNRRVTRLGQANIAVPASNAFNNFGRTMYVSYDPQTEIDLGLIQLPTQKNEGTFDRLLIRGSYFINDDWEVALDWSTSESESFGIQWMFATQQNANFSNTTQARLEELLASSDPNVAINLFGDGTGQNPTIAELLVPFSAGGNGSDIETIEGFVRGELMEMQGSDLELVVGTEQRKEGNGANTRDLRAYFAELRVPVIGIDNNLPLVDTMMVSLKMRRDTYDTRGASGRDADGELNIVDVTFSNTAPFLGVYWEVNDELKIRGSISESFQAPTFNSLFGTSSGRFQGAWDPLCACRVPTATFIYGPNPDLQPEYADNINLGFDWTPLAVSGLQIKLNYAEVDFQDRIAGSFELRNLLPVEVYGNLPEFFQRADDGTLIEARSTSVNLTRRVSQTLDLNVLKVFQTQYGTITPTLNWHYVLDMFDQASANSAKTSFVDEIIGIDKQSIAGGVTWLRGKLTVDVIADYTPGYLNNSWETSPFRDIPNSDIGSRTTFDMSVKYVMDNGITLRAGGRNIFNRGFPFAINPTGLPYDTTRVDLRGRVLFLDVSYEFDR